MKLGTTVIIHNYARIYIQYNPDIANSEGTEETSSI